MRSSDLLVLKYDELAARSTAFYRKMAESPAFRALFLKDPAGTASAMLLPADEQPPAAQIRRANRLLFALLSNAGFMEWAAGFQARLNEQVATVENVPEGERPKMAAATLDRAAVYREIVDAMAKHIDPEIMASLLMAASTGGGAGITSRPPDRQVPVVVLDAPFIVAYQISVDIVYIVSGATLGALSRVDLERAAAFLSEELPARAREVRASGALVDLEMLAEEAES